MNVNKLKTPERRDLETFFGCENISMKANNYFTYKSVLDDNTIIVLTNNIKRIKSNYVLIVGKNKGLYLRAWQFRKVCSYREGINCYAVKLFRTYYDPYEYDFVFKDMDIEEDITFDMWHEEAIEQEKENFCIRKGWLNEYKKKA